MNHHLHERVSLLRGETFGLIAELESALRAPSAAGGTTAAALVSLQGVANRLGRAQALLSEGAIPDISVRRRD